MGTPYLGKIFTCGKVAVFVAFAAAAGPILAQSKSIEFPEPPKVVPPVQIDQKTADQDLQRKKENLKEDHPEPAKEILVHEEKKEEALARESAAPRPLRYMFEASLLVTSTKVSGNREHYKSDPTSHFNFAYRFTRGLASDLSGFVGVRIAPFAGTGKQDGYQDRFNFLYIGPSIGFGKLSARESSSEDKSRPAESAADSSDARLAGGSRLGWLVTSGISAVSRASSRGESLVNEDDRGEDFRSKSLGFDSPGVWLEARFLYVLYNSIHLSPQIGVQLGAGKTIGYFGFGFGGWY